MSSIVLKVLNGIYGWVVGIVIAGCIAYAGYALWDNAQIYKSAQNVQESIRKLKPESNTDDGPSFEELLAINGDVKAWITVDGTNIDYPVLQTDNNLTYMDKDVYKDFSLAGSLFIDARNSGDFTDPYSLIYGHNMDKHLMFGDLALFKEKTFFEENRTATLMLPGETRQYAIVAVLQVSAGSSEIFNPTSWTGGLTGFGEYLKNISIWYHGSLVARICSTPDDVEILSLATCSSGSTNDRTILVLMRTKDGNISTVLKEDKGSGAVTGAGIVKTGDTNELRILKIVVAVAALLASLEGISLIKEKKRKKKPGGAS